MNRYALIRGGVVDTVVEQDTLPTVDLGGAWVPCAGTVGPGDTWDGTTFTPPASPVAARHITQLAFLNRFTDAEAVGIDLASIGATVQAASMRRYQNKVSAAKYIDLERADTRGGVQALESAGLLGAGRALEILDNPIADEERAT